MRKNLLRLVSIFSLLKTEAMEPQVVSGKEVACYIKEGEQYLEETKLMPYAEDKQKISDMSLMDFLLETFHTMENINASNFNLLFYYKDFMFNSLEHAKKSLQNFAFDIQKVKDLLSSTNQEMDPYAWNFIQEVEYTIKITADLKAVRYKIYDVLSKTAWKQKIEMESNIVLLPPVVEPWDKHDQYNYLSDIVHIYTRFKKFVYESNVEKEIREDEQNSIQALNDAKRMLDYSKDMYLGETRRHMKNNLRILSKGYTIYISPEDEESYKAIQMEALNNLEYVLQTCELILSPMDQARTRILNEGILEECKVLLKEVLDLGKEISNKEIDETLFEKFEESVYNTPKVWATFMKECNKLDGDLANNILMSLSAKIIQRDIDSYKKDEQSFMMNFNSLHLDEILGLEGHVSTEDESLQSIIP